MRITRLFFSGEIYITFAWINITSCKLRTNAYTHHFEKPIPHYLCPVKFNTEASHNSDVFKSIQQESHMNIGLDSVCCTTNQPIIHHKDSVWNWKKQKRLSCASSHVRVRPIKGVNMGVKAIDQYILCTLWGKKWTWPPHSFLGTIASGQSKWSSPPQKLIPII